MPEITDGQLQIVQDALDLLGGLESTGAHEFDVLTCIGALHRILRRRGVVLTAQRQRTT